MPAKRIVGVGHVALDHVFSVDALPARAVKTPARRYRGLVGGMTANALVAAARLGAATRIVSPVGDDASVRVFVEHLEREGVDASGLCRVAGESSSLSAIVVDAQGERMIVNHRGSALLRAPALDPAVLAGADALLADPRCVHWAETALRSARAMALPAVFDGDTAPREDLQRLVGLAHWVVFSEPGLAAYADGTPADVLARALAAGAAVAVATRGEHGLAWQRAGGPMQTMPAFAVAPVVDTTAAGDVFHGALALALAEGQADLDALRFAAAAAALKCLQPDGVLGAPRREAVQALLATAG